MKKLFTLLLTVSLLADVFASSELFVRIRKNGNFIVSVNNQTIQNNSSIFRFFDLNTGYCTITVRENSWNNMIVFQQSVPIRNGYRYVAEISPRYGMRLIARYPFVQTNWYLDNVNTNVQKPFYYGNPYNNGNHNGWYNKTKNNQGNDDDAGWYNNNWNSDDVYVDDNEDWNGSWNSGSGQSNQQPNNSGWYNPNDNNSSWQNPNQQNQNQNGYGNGQYYGNNNYGNKTTMSDAELQTLLTTMKGVSFEEKMIDVAKSATKNRWVTTQQVRQMLDLFSFEKNKLDLAKYLYEFSSDKNNYYTLVSAFNFSSNQKELTDYLKNHK